MKKQVYPEKNIRELWVEEPSVTLHIVADITIGIFKAIVCTGTNRALLALFFMGSDSIKWSQVPVRPQKCQQ